MANSEQHQASYFNQESERLLYRKLSSDDIPSWVEFFENNDRLAFLGIDLSKDKISLATDWITKQFERYEQQGLGHLAVIEKTSGSLVGVGGILPRELNGSAEFEIAYSLKPVYWGKGYGTEIARQMRKFGHENKVFPYFISIIDKANFASIHVARKNGMHILYETAYLGMQVYVFGDIEHRGI